MMKTRTCLILLLLVSLTQAAPIGTGFTYQGELKYLGIPANGPFDFQFELFDTATDGSSIAGPVPLGDVNVVDGVFTVELDFGCRAGSCGTCITAVKSGEVSYVEEPGSLPESGSCLACIAVPKSDLALDA